MEGYLKFFEMSSSILNLFYLAIFFFLMYLHEWFRVIFNQEPNV